MAIHLTPLKRSQILDLGKLMESALQSSTSSSCSSPRASPTGLANGGSNNVNVNSVSNLSEHPFACGTFCDVFEDPLTRRAWRLHEKILYVVWWSYRPACCAACGMRDTWVPSADSEMKCFHCGSDAGTTVVKEIVEDLPAVENEDSGNDDGESDCGDLVGGSNKNNNNNNSNNADGGGPVSQYMFFYEWLSRMQVMERGKGVVIPTGEQLAAVLRAAYDLALLFAMPGMPSGGAAVVQGGALYLSLVLHRFPAPFPLFRLAGRVHHVHMHPGNGALANDNNRNNNNNVNNKEEEHVTSNAAWMTTASGEQKEELQWVDVELLAALIGVSLSDFFESCRVAVQYLQNVMTVAANFAVPSVLWHPQRVEGRAEYMMALHQKRRCCSSLHSTAVSSGLSPEHTAMIVALELAREFDSKPCTSLEQRERVGAWLDSLGLYPQRNVYRNRSKAKNHNNGNNNNNTVNGDNPCFHSSHPSMKNAAEDSRNGNTSQLLLAAVDDKAWCASPMTTDTSPFAGTMQRVLLSPCANALLYVFATVFSMPALELADMTVRSGLYNGPTCFFDTLRRAAESGDYTLMPLCRRLSPISSLWTSAYFAVHSEDRLPLLAALQHLRAATTREKEIPVARVVQRILRKHQASRRYQFNYSICVTDDYEKQQFKGVYFLSYVTSRFAVYTGIRSARKTLTFDAATGRITLCIIGAKERHVDTLALQFNGPVIAHVETESAKCVIDCARQSLSAESWQATVRHLDRCGRVRRRMRVPMLASRLDALASVREATAMASHPIACNATLLGWGETEVLFTSLPHVHNATYLPGLRRELQQNLLSLPKPSLVFGFSENRVIAMYASLVLLLERIERQLSVQRSSQSSPSHVAMNTSLSLPLSVATTTTTAVGAASRVTWVDVLLSEEEEEQEQWDSNAMVPVSSGTPQNRDTPPSHMSHVCTSGSGGNNAMMMMDTSMLLPASTAAVQQQQQQREQQQQQKQQEYIMAPRRTSSRGRETRSVPTYQEVLLGLAGQPGNGGGRNRLTRVGRLRTTTQREQQQHSSSRRGAQQHSTQQHHQLRGDAENGFGSSGAAGLSSVNCSSFNLFSAEDCRRRLYRLLEFIAVYKEQRRERDKSTTGAVAASAEVHKLNVNGSEANGMINHMLETFTNVQNEPPSPRPSYYHHPQEQQQQQQPSTPQENSALKQNTPPNRNGTTPLIAPQPNRHHRHPASPYLAGNNCNNNNNNNNNCEERQGVSRKRSRLRNGDEWKGGGSERGDSNEGETRITPSPRPKQQQQPLPPPLRLSSSPSSSSSSSSPSRSSSVGRCSSNSVVSASRRPQRRRRKK